MVLCLRSEQGLELDLFLLQCCAALSPPNLFVHRIIERFGLLHYLSLLPECSSEYVIILLTVSGCCGLIVFILLSLME